MKKQWIDFIYNNNFPYDSIKHLVLWLVEAVERKDHDLCINILGRLLYYYGIMLDSEYNLVFASDYILSMFNDM